MNTNPYQAPGAPVVPAPPRKPGQIKLALTILTISLMINLLHPLFYVFAGGAMAEKSILAIIMIVLLLSGGPILLAVFLLFVGLRHNWARWAWLAFMLLIWFYALVPTEGAPPRPMLGFVRHGLEIVGTLLLFVGAGAQWFKRADKAGTGA